jgi:hypothetical protein
MNFDTGEFNEKFVSRSCFRSDLTSLTTTLQRLCLCLHLHIRFGQYRTTLSSYMQV